MGQLPGPTRRLRDGALYMVNNTEAVHWALELYGFKDVSIKVRALTCPRRFSRHAERPQRLCLL